MVEGSEEEASLEKAGTKVELGVMVVEEKDSVVEVVEKVEQKEAVD